MRQKRIVDFGSQVLSVAYPTSAAADGPRRGLRNSAEDR